MELLFEVGYDQLHVTDITRRANYGRSTFYLYFADKVDFVTEIFQLQLQQLHAQIKAAVHQLPHPERERKAWHMTFTAIDAQSDFWLSFDGKEAAMIRELHRRLLLTHFEEQLQTGFYRLPLHVPPGLGAHFLVGASQEILLYKLRHPNPQEIDIDILSDQSFGLIFGENKNKAYL